MGNHWNWTVSCFRCLAVEPRLARLALMIMDSIRSLLWAMFMSLGGWLLRLLGYGFDWKLGRGLEAGPICQTQVVPLKWLGYFGRLPHFQTPMCHGFELAESKLTCAYTTYIEMS